MKEITFFVLASLLFIFNTGAQTKTLTVQILNEETKLPVAGAVIASDGKSFNRVSDETGIVTLATLSANSIRISAVGYSNKTIALSDITADGKIFLKPTITSLQEIKLGASSRTGIFHTISDLDIHLRPIINSQEVLRIVPGLFIGQHAGGGKAEQIFLRGFDIDHGTDIQINVDGMPVNMVSHAHGQGYADLHFVIPELIDKVNFSKGPYFADKGNFATAGYVEFKTKDYLENNFIKLEGGQFNTYRAVAGINLLNKKQKEKNQSLYLGGEGSYTKGFFESPQDFNRFNGIVKYHGKISSRSSLTSYISGFASKWDASGQIPSRSVADGSIGFYGAIDDTEGGETSRYNFSNTLVTNFNNGLRWKNQLYYSRYNFELYSNFTFFLENPANGDQIKQKEARDLVGFNSSIEKEQSFGKTKALFQAGLQSRFDKTLNSELSNTKNRDELLSRIMEGNIAELNVGLFAEEKIRFTGFDLTLGLRGDYFENRYNDHLMSQTAASHSFIISPKLNLTYRVSEKVQLYSFNGQGFHSNDTRVAVQQNGREVVTPAWGSDLGGIFKLGKKAVFQTAFWYLWMKQEFVYVGDAGVVEPGGKTQRMGWDASLRYQLMPALYADIDLNYTDPRILNVPEAENNLPLAPKFTSTGGFTYRKATGWNGTMRYRWMGDRPANEDNTVKARGYFICDAAVNYSKKKWEAGLSFQNIFGQKWKETQFDTESRLQNEPAPVSEIHFTPGTPFFVRANFRIFF